MCFPVRIRPRTTAEPAELLALESRVARDRRRCVLPEPSIARLSADGDAVYVVGTSSLFRAHWDGARLDSTTISRRAIARSTGQTYGWDCGLASGGLVPRQRLRAASATSGTFPRPGRPTGALICVRVDLATRA